MSADDKAYYRGKIDEELSKRHPNEKKIKLWDNHLFALEEGVSGKSQNISLSLPACLFPFLFVALIQSDYYSGCLYVIRTERRHTSWE